MAAEVHFKDIGTILRLTIYRNNGDVEATLGSASTIQIKLSKPSGTVSVKTAVLTGDGSDGRMEYVTIADDLDETGTWGIQGYAVWSSAKKLHTSKRDFDVKSIYVT